MNRRAATLSVLVLVSLAWAATGPPAYSQAADDGVPDLNGVWAWGRCLEGPGFGCMLLEADDPRLTARARAFQAAFDEVTAPKYDCAPMTIPHMFTDPYSYRIEQLEDRVVFTHGKDDVVRTVWLEGHGHPAPPVNRYFVQGYATGRYEDGALVVVTTKFTFDPTGLNSDFKLPSSTQKRVTERYSREGEALRLGVTIEDTFFLREPWVFEVRSQRDEQPLDLPWDCQLEAARQSLRLLSTDYPEDPEVVRIQP